MSFDQANDEKSGESALKFKWTPQLQIGVEEMDQEHRVLIDHMNQVYLLNHSGARKSEILDSLRNLIEYSRTHFSDEENYMASIHFPDLKLHRQAHEALLQRLESDYRQFESGGVVLSEGFFSFLGFWLKTHIHAVDTKYGHFAKHKHK